MHVASGVEKDEVMRRAAKRGIDIEQVLPFDRYARLCIDYANLKSLDAEALTHFAQHIPELPHFLGLVDFAYTWPTPSIARARQLRTHAWVRQLLDTAANHKALNAEDDETLGRLFERRQIVVQLSYRRGKREGVVHVPGADLLWFIGAGASVLFDKKGQYHDVVRRCDNFAGSTYTKLQSTACGNYMLKISDGGPKPRRFCSPECRNRVNQREKTRKSPYRE
jgi:hypothetical protein